MSISTEDIWNELSEKLAAFIRRRVRDDDVAADLLQETFVRIHNGIDGVRDEERLHAWVFRVARSTIVDFFRRSKPTQTLLGDALTETSNAPLNHNEEVSRWLPGMIGSLPEKYRAAVELAELQGLTQAQVAERLGLSLSGAKSRVQRGRELLKEVLLQCCHLELDRRGNVVDYERRGGCEGCKDC